MPPGGDRACILDRVAPGRAPAASSPARRVHPASCRSRFEAAYQPGDDRSCRVPKRLFDSREAAPEFAREAALERTDDSRFGAAFASPGGGQNRGRPLRSTEGGAELDGGRGLGLPFLAADHQSGPPVRLSGDLSVSRVAIAESDEPSPLVGAIGRRSMNGVVAE